MTQNNNQLPKDWKRVKLGETGKILSGGTPSTAIPEYWNGNINWIAPSDLTRYKNKSIRRGKKSISESGLKNSSARLMPKGSVLFSSRAPIGYVVIADSELCTNQGFKSIIPNENLISDFLYYFLLASKRNAEQVASGTTFKEISLSKFSELSIPLPPKPIQQVIVSKIEELFSEIEKGIESLFTAQQQLKTYRQSVLKWAFEGKLTNSLNYDSNDLHEDYDLNIAAEDEAEYKTKKNQGNQNNQINHSSDKGKLPKGWKWVMIKDVTEINPKLPNKENISKQLEVQFLPMKLVEEIINKIHLTEIRKYEDVLKGSYTPFINCDVIFAKVTPCMENGKIAIVDNLKNGIGFGSSEFHVIRSGGEIIKEFIFYYLVQDRFRHEAASEMTGAVGLRRVPKQFIENHDIPLPPVEEQKKIIQEIESRLSVADKMEESINQSLQQAEALRQSILKKAFEGRLSSNF